LCFAIAGAVLLNAMLPFEIAFLFSAVGHPQPLPYLGVFLTAVALSLSISAIIAVVMDMQSSPAPVVEAPATPIPATPIPATPIPATPALPPSGLAARIDLAGLHAIVAEDHYLRLHFANGRQPLVLYRFGDAVRELARIDGQQVHRGAWVAAAARPQALRDGRKWRLQLENGTMIAISDTYLPLVRRRGWLGQ
jgi:DNA-binding LytR/AlgR family response regulator